MSVTETGYQTYQMWNMYDEGGSAGEMSQITLSPSSNAQLISAPFNGGTITLQGNFSINGPTLADVSGTLNDISVTQNGALWFTDHYSNGADWQNLIHNFEYSKSLLSGNDVFTASSTANINDIVQSLDGNDVFTGYGDADGYNGSTGDQFYGGNGVDTAVYRGASSQYSIQDTRLPDLRELSGQMLNAKTVTDHVANRDGLDKLFDVERLHFSDVNIAFDTEGNAGDAYRLYKAAFDRAPDEGGLGFWINALDHGANLVDVAQGFINSDEFTAMYGKNASNETFVDLLYHHVLHRAAEGEGYDYWVNSLNHGATRAQVLEFFSNSPENVAQTADLVANGIHYQEFLG